jgi:quercetin dioxygenase-like cupin family protein
VTGHSSAGIAKVLMDGTARNAKFPTEGLISTLLWCTDRTPADIAIGEAVEDMGARIIGTPPPPRGSRFCMMEFAPGTRSAMHRTETVDYIVVLSGEVDMEMDDSTVTLRAGDVMVQRGTNHAWVNNGSETARFAVVLLDAEPLGIGRPVSQTDTAR